MTEFLRDLSPQRAHDATRAVALLPSQFETIHPLRLARAMSQQAERPDRGLSIQESPSLPVAPLHAPDIAALSATQVPAANAHATSVNAAAAPPIQSRAIPVPPSSESHERAPAARDAEPIVRTTTTLSHMIQSTQAPRLIDPEHPIRSETVAVTAKAVAPRVPASQIAQTPMSRRALAARPPQRSDSRPVVHVTIDRIEVRAPSAPERPKPSTRSRATPPSLSLNDYLRSHEPDRRGGTS